MLFMAMTLCVGFTSCDKDEDDLPSIGNNGGSNDDDDDEGIVCNACGGSGICPNCGGDGEVGDRNCGYCDHWNGTCPICGGEGYY